jgi:hypothetical protein
VSCYDTVMRVQQPVLILSTLLPSAVCLRPRTCITATAAGLSCNPAAEGWGGGRCHHEPSCSEQAQ